MAEATELRRGRTGTWNRGFPPPSTMLFLSHAAISMEELYIEKEV